MTDVIAGVLLKGDIERLGIISENAVASSYKPASYDLRIGNDCIDPADGYEDERGDRQTFSRGPLHGQVLTVKPFSSLIVSTHEVLNIPPNIVGRFNLRIKFALQGLFVQMGTQVEPNYRGRLFAVVNNITAEPIKLDWQEESRARLFTIEFFPTNGLVPDTGSERNSPLLHIRDFVVDNEYAKSSIQRVVSDVRVCEKKLKKTKKRFKEQQDVSYERLVNRFDGELRNLEVKWESAEAVADVQDRLNDAAVRKIQDENSQARIETSELENKLTEVVAKTNTRVDELSAKVEGVKQTRYETFWGIAFAGVFLLFLSVIIPVAIDFAIDVTTPWRVEGTYLADVADGVSELKKQVEAIDNSKPSSSELNALKAEVIDLRATLAALEDKVEYNSQNEGDATFRNDR